MEVLRVEFYSGSKREENPRIVFTDLGAIRVERVIETRLEEDYQSGNRKKVFIFKSMEGGIYRLESSKIGFNISIVK